MELNELRKQIDNTNEKIIEALGERAKIVKKIGEYKKERGIETLDSSRENEVFRKIKIIAEKHNLNQDFIIKIFEEIISQSRKEQNKNKI